MESVLREIFAGKSSEAAHRDFVKFSKGSFTDRYIVDAKRQKEGWSIKTGPEYTNFLVEECLSKVKEPIKLTGVITATFDVKSKAKFEISDVKNAMGVKKAVVDTTTEPEKILSLMREFPKAFFALSFSTPQTTLKIKAKAPKSAKPAAAGAKEPKAEFCSIKTTDRDIVDNILFGATENKAVSIKHVIDINEIVLPKGVSDPVQIREQSKRKGIIRRIVTFEGKAKEEKVDFFV